MKEKLSYIAETAINWMKADRKYDTDIRGDEGGGGARLDARLYVEMHILLHPR